MTTEPKLENPKKGRNYNRFLCVSSIIFFSLFIILLGIQWYFINKNINEIEEKNRVYFEKIKTIKDYGPFQIDIQKINNRQVIINPKEVDKINNHIKTLTEQADKESNRAKEIIDKDIDRLNLYMAVGIGFLTIIGIFVPLVINVLSYQDLKDKTEELETNLNKALDKSNEVDKMSESVSNLESQTKKSFPKINTLTLQYAIIRYLSIAPYINLRNGNDKKQYVSLLETIKNSFKECNSNNIPVTTDCTFKNAIEDFSYFIIDPRNQLSFFNRKIQNEFTSLAKLLENHILINDIEKEKQSYNLIVLKINDIITLI